MNHENGDGPAVDALLEKVSQGSVPPDVEMRLENRMQEFYRTLDTRPARALLPVRVRQIIPESALVGLAAASRVAACVLACLACLYRMAAVVAVFFPQ